MINSDQPIGEECFGGGFIMEERKAALLRVHERNIDRYQRLLKTKLSEAEVDYLQKRLSEERLTVAMLQFTSPTGEDAPSIPTFARRCRN
jgi:hypothetical protein